MTDGLQKAKQVSAALTRKEAFVLGRGEGGSAGPPPAVLRVVSNNVLGTICYWGSNLGLPQAECVLNPRPHLRPAVLTFIWPEGSKMRPHY